MPRERDNKENGRKRRYSDVLEDLYRGPQEFMEAGVRGFLVTSIPEREEHSIDETVKVLRKTCVKLYGGIKPLKREDASFAKGYVMIDFMDPEKVVPLPHPDADKVAEEEKAKAEDEAAKEGAKEGEEMEEESKAEESKQGDGDAGDDKPKAEGEGEGENTTEEGKPKEEKEKGEEKKKKEDTKKRRDEERKPLMLAPHKFKGYRTELRNMMFIKSDIPDPVEVVTACFDLMLNRKPLYTDCVNQLLPVQGVCDNDYKQLEIMCRRVLVPYVGEHLEEPPSFGVMLVNKMCEPGAEVLLEVVRSAVWCLNPCAWQCSPWSEPDVTIHIELIGSKIILCAMPHYMKYRQYSPFAVFELGTGKAEDEEKLMRERDDGGYPRRDRGCRGGRRKQKNQQKHEKGDQAEKKEGDDKEKDNKEEQPTEVEATQGGETEQADQVKEEEKPAEVEAAPEEKKDITEKKSSRSRDRKSKS